MTRRPPRATRTYTIFPYTTSSGRDQQQRRVGSRERAPLPVAVLESRALVELDGAAADAQRVLPAVVALRLQRHLAGAIQAHVAGLVVGGERLDRERGSAGEQQQRGGGQEGLVHAEGLHHWIPWYSINRSEEHTSELQSLMRISYAVFCLKK